MFSYINPVFTEFDYITPNQRHEVTDILAGLVKRYQGVMPEIDFKRQIIIPIWDKKNKQEAPRLTLSWQVPGMSEALYQRLRDIFRESVLDDKESVSREHYRRLEHVPANFVRLDGHFTKKGRGFPIYSYSNGDIAEDAEDLSKLSSIFWITRQFGTLKEAREKMRGRGKSYWFYTDGKFMVELRLASCREIEFIDTALRVSVALNGSYEGFERYKALSLAQKQLVRRNKERVAQEEVVGLEDLIEDIKFRQFFATIYPERAKALGVTDESVLLVGVPGTGKSTIASSLLFDPMLESIMFVPLNVTELLEASFSSEKHVDTFFNGIKALNRRYGFRPTLWCDDLESAFMQDMGRGSREMAATQSTLLNNLQGVSKNIGVRISGSTNYPERIDQRFLEFGRISYMFHIPIPKDPKVLTGILKSHIEKRGQTLADNLNIDEVAANSAGFTPRMLVNLVNEAGIQAARRIFGRFSTTEESRDLEVTPEDYKKADGFLRKRSDLGLLTRRDEEIANFVERHNKRFGF